VNQDEKATGSKGEEEGMIWKERKERGLGVAGGDNFFWPGKKKERKKGNLRKRGDCERNRAKIEKARADGMMIR